VFCEAPEAFMREDAKAARAKLGSRHTPGKPPHARWPHGTK
jgi:hypothetical protein